MKTTTTRFTGKQLDDKLNQINASLGLQCGDIGSLERSTYGGIGSRIEIITDGNRSTCEITARTTPRKAFEEFYANRYSVLDKMREIRKPYKCYSNHVKNLVIQHVIDCANVNTLAEAKDVFKADYDAWNCDYHERLYPNNQQRYTAFLESCEHVEVYYHEMRAFLDTLSLTPPRKEPSDQQVSELYRNLIFKALN